ncbi:MAG TPA: VCBS repeat-containing protein, partial [Chryseolinea sp.]|nr:VCBS repeat-containing protein [Chryseolinea sp.]
MLRIICVILAPLIVFSCSKEAQQKLFEEQLPETTGIDFENKVIQDQENHVLNYPYYFNGGGVAVGDINNDGLEDVYFSGNSVPNRLYLNKGNFQFEDITEKATVNAVQGWKTGVLMADVNQDGWMDIYVCRSAMADSVLRKNLLFINNGDLTFTEKADEFGVADNSYSTHASFFDYDKDGDLDLFVLNHSLPKYAGFNNMLVNFKKQKGSKFQSKLYQNNKGKFSDVSEKAGIINNLLSFGLGLAVSDINQDGWPDVYVSNDFNEEDYLYINNQDGTFNNAIRQATGHVSLFSMGSDVADVNNDALPDIFTLDMLPESNERIKLSSGDDNYDKYRILINSGFHHQSMRNMLQLNNGDGTFSEIGQLMGISNTDWSWSSLFADFDGDGWKDLFISNGYEKDYTNMQFLKYTVDERLKSRETGIAPDVNQIIGQMPSIQVGNFLFKNNGDLTFAKKSEAWGISRLFKSNGAAYADLDNDGDLDLLINTINEKSVLYKNTASENRQANFLKVDLRKSNPKKILEGAKVIVYDSGDVQYQEFSSVRGFQSSMYVPLTFGLSNQSVVDSVRVIWADNKTELMKNISVKKTITPRYEDAKTIYAYPTVVKPLFEETYVLEWKHDAVDTNDFKRQLLLPKMYSYAGPKMAKGDVNQDGLEDIYICGARHQPGALFLQGQDGSFKAKKNSAFEKDKDCQDEDAIFFDADQDDDLDLYVVSGGYFFGEKDPLLQDRLYLNDGRSNFTRSGSGLPVETLAGSCVAPLDVDNDNDVDLFIGTRLIPGSYPISSQSIVLINDGRGNFTDKTAQHLPLSNVGMVCDAVAIDINKDGAQDLIVAGEWTPLKIFINTKNQLLDESDKWLSTPTKGWWNCIVAEDFDKDGDVDFMAGNYGLNNQFKISSTRPATLVYKDFNMDGQID